MDLFGKYLEKNLSKELIYEFKNQEMLEILLSESDIRELLRYKKMDPSFIVSLIEEKKVKPEDGYYNQIFDNHMGSSSSHSVLYETKQNIISLIISKEELEEFKFYKENLEKEKHKEADLIEREFYLKERKEKLNRKKKINKSLNPIF